jgi:hypothetical protein
MTTKTDGIQPDVPRDGMTDEDDEMRPEYDFSGGQRGRLFARFQEGYEIVISGPDGEQRIQVSAAEMRAQAAKIERLRKQRDRKKSRRSMSARQGSSGEENG